MSKIWHNIFRKRTLLVAFATVIVFTVVDSFLSSCDMIGLEDEHDGVAEMKELESRDPLPGELVMQTLLEDSVKGVRKSQLQKQMSGILLDYRKRYRSEHFTGYFLTDLDHDGLPELWVKIGNYRDNAKLELYYPMPDGSLLKSDTFAEPGHYYVGDDYILQVVGKGPGYLNVNKISVKKGQMQIENIDDIDLYSSPGASIPEFAEREIRDTSFQNLTVLNNALL